MSHPISRRDLLKLAAAQGLAALPAAPAPASQIHRPSPGVTNSLTVLGESLLDSVPVVCICGDVARGDKYRPFQIHALPNVALLQNVCKEVLEVRGVGVLPQAVRHAFRLARAGEPGPVG